jgi:hypothetical protein
MRGPASIWRCPFLGRPADAFHHVTGSGSDAIHLDPPLVVAVSLRAHGAEHVGWRSTGIDDTQGQDQDTLRLRRAAHFLVRLGEHHGDKVVTLPAETVAQLGLLLHRIADGRRDR